MSLLYRVLYGLGITPWEEMSRLPIAKQIGKLFDREEQGREPPYGSALDLGCGSGQWSVALARRGWKVTGVELVPKALHAAERRAAAAGEAVRFVQGDITALEKMDLEPARLVLDFGAVHGLRAPEQRAVAQGVTAVAEGDATLLMLAFTPGSRGPLPRGMDRREIENVYREWKVVDEELHDLTGAPKVIRNAAPRWYRLVRR